jgi:UDP-N-acetylglucosamine 2-epimerase (non-hydrolysing)/GDP/UDP-N,N'-diacetylbacillosamine 2-epimerase (hydrolysing)
MTSGKRKLCVVTGSRAEYGLLRRLMREIAVDPALKLQLIVTGAHCVAQCGLTVREIEADGWHIDAQVDMLLSSDNAVGITKSIGLALIGLADAFARLSPDIVIVLGDRYEILAVAQAAMFARIPIAHLHGGERTDGAYDDAIRHAITKMSHWHFVAAEEYRRRVVQLGESSQRVYAFGAPGLDELQDMQWLTHEQLSESLEFDCAAPLLLVTYHPATLGRLAPAAAMQSLLDALDDIGEARVVFTAPNADTAGQQLAIQVEQWAARRSQRARAFKSLGRQRYLSLMRICDAVVGNSSSGLLEAPALKRAAVNVGERQDGRLKAQSIIDVPEERAAIAAGIRRALSAEFQAQLPHSVSLYGRGNVSKRICEVLAAVDLSDRKTFVDLDYGR